MKFYSCGNDKAFTFIHRTICVQPASEFLVWLNSVFLPQTQLPSNESSGEELFHILSV